MSEIRERTALYRIYGAGDVLLYVGIACDFCRRWKDHARSKPWWPQAQRFTVEWHKSRERAEVAEATAIRGEGPRFNVVYNVAGGRRRNAPAPANPPASPPPVRTFTAVEAASVLQHAVAAWLGRLAAAGDIPSEDHDGARRWTATQLADIARALDDQNPRIAVAARPVKPVHIHLDPGQRAPLVARTPRRKHAKDTAA